MELGMGNPSFAKGIHVLVVDHDKHSLQSISSLLQNCSFKVTISEEAGAALTMIMEEKAEPFNLVMANATESNMNALSFLHQIGIPIILMASVTDMKTAGKAVADWGCHFLEKPITIEDVDLVWQVAYRKIRNPRPKNLLENANDSQIDGSISRIVNVAREVEWRSIEENANEAWKSQNDGSISRIVNVARGVQWRSIEENANQAQKPQIDGSISRIVNFARGVEWNSIEENANQAQIPQIDGSISRMVNVEWESIEEHANQAQKPQVDRSISRITNVARGVEWKSIEEHYNVGDGGIREARLKPSATVFNYLETTMMNAEEKTNKRSRIVWSSKLHRKFTEALSKLGNRKSSPKIILKMMNEPSLTLRQVASHLQKFKSQVKHLNKITASDASTSLGRNQLQQLPAKLNTNILGQPNYSSNITTDNLTQLQAPSCLNGPSPILPSQAVDCYLKVMNPNSSNSYKTTQHGDLHPETCQGFEGMNLVEDNHIFTDELYMNESSDGFAQASHFNLQYFGADEDCPFLSADNHHLDAVQELEFAQNLAGCLDFDKITTGAHSGTTGLLNQNVALKELDNLLNNTEEDPMVCCRYDDEMNSFDIDQYSEWLNA